jgi:NitT/TauT family transport system substrate-binding protein
MLSRRDFTRLVGLAGMAGAGALAVGSAGCRASHDGVVRIGFMTNLTHAPAIVGIASGRIQQALGVRVEAMSFRAGPRVVEALVGDAIDVGVAGPSAIVYTHARHGAGLLRVLSGCSSGGASFVVGAQSGIHGPGDLRGKTLATPQIGTTQDIALRKYLKVHGYEPAERGGDVTVHALDATTIFTEIKRNQLDGAWLPEPWATRVVEDAHAVRLVDERDLWPNRRFPTALVAARGSFVKERPALAAALVSAMAVEVDRAVHAPDATCDAARAELSRLLGKALPARLLHDAWPYIDYTTDPLADALQTLAEDATLLGLAPRSTCSTLFAPIPLAPESGRPS